MVEHSTALRMQATDAWAVVCAAACGQCAAVGSCEGGERKKEQSSMLQVHTLASGTLRTLECGSHHNSHVFVCPCPSCRFTASPQANGANGHAAYLSSCQGNGCDLLRSILAVRACIRTVAFSSLVSSDTMEVFKDDVSRRSSTAKCSAMNRHGQWASQAFENAFWNAVVNHFGAVTRCFQASCACRVAWVRIRVVRVGGWGPRV